MASTPPTVPSQALDCGWVNDPRSFDLAAALLASATDKAQRRKTWDERVSVLAAKVTALDAAASLDLTTPTDGHCLFHALAAGGLLAGIPESLTIPELRDLAISQATLEQLQTAAASTGETGLTVEDYVDGMRKGLFGDNLVIAVLCQELKRNIPVVSAQSVRSCLAEGGEVAEVAPNAVWVAHLPEATHESLDIPSLRTKSTETMSN